VLTILLLRAEHLILGRRGYSVVGGKQGAPRLVRLGWLKWVALGLVFLVLMLPVFLPYGALFNAAFSRVARSSSRLTISHSRHQLRVLRTVGHQARGQEHRHSRIPFRHIGTILAVVISYGDVRAKRSRATGRSDFWPPHRSPFRGSCSALDCS